MKQQKEKNKKSLNSLINFIKYHNAFAIAVSLVVAGMSLTFAASPEIRQDVVASLVSAKETVRSIDNTYIVGVDLANFDFGLQITDIKEDNDSYYISYVFKTIYIKDYVWQDIGKEGVLTAVKSALAGQDLGFFVAEELGEMINAQLSYLKEVQQLEKQKGLSQKIVSIEYAGLIGRFLDAKEETFPGYEPVVSPLAVAQESPAPASSPPPETLVVAVSSLPAVQPILDRDFVRQIVEELLAQERQSSLSETNLSTESSAPIESPTPTPDVTSPATVELSPQPVPEAVPETPAEPVSPQPSSEPVQTESAPVVEPAPAVEASASVAPAESASDSAAGTVSTEGNLGTGTPE